MDYKKAIEVLSNEIGCVDLDTNNRGYIYESEQKFMDACNTAISAMKELQSIHDNGISLERLKDIDFRKQVVEHINYMEYMDIKDELEEYRQIGTLEEVQEAVERQREKKIINISKGDKLRFGTCPICNRRISTVEGGNYCQNCGQHILWEVEDE